MLGCISDGLEAPVVPPGVSVTVVEDLDTEHREALIQLVTVVFIYVVVYVLDHSCFVYSYL